MLEETFLKTSIQIPICLRLWAFEFQGITVHPNEMMTNGQSSRVSPHSENEKVSIKWKMM